MRIFLFIVALIVALTLIAAAAAWSGVWAAEARGYSSVNILSGVEQGALIYGKAPAGAKVLVEGESVKTTPDGRFVFGVDRDAPGFLDIAVVDKNGFKMTKTLEVKMRQWGVEEIDGIDDEMMNPTPEDEIKISRDRAGIKKARAQVRDDVFPLVFVAPVDTEINSSFGAVRILNGEEKDPHGGVDMRGQIGDEVKASADGVVSYVNEDSFYNGKIVIINHGFGVSSAYAHLSEIEVQKGQWVRQGEVIGKVGSTGRSTGPHLHFGITWKNTKLDPQKLIEAEE